MDVNPTSYRLAASAPWLKLPREQLAAALRADRLPHAILIQGQPGAGKAALADYIARSVLCDRPARAPCGECASCHLHEAGTHPDLRRVGLVDDKKQVAVDDIRELIGTFSLRSFRGGRRVALIDPADAMSTSGANALLKTLEEPTPGALLVLTASRPDRLPATVASRCQRLMIRTPATADALAWLSGIDATVEWAGALALAAGAPVRALELARAGVLELEREMAELPARLSRPDVDLVGLAERCQERLPAERLRWIENWVTDRIRRGLKGPAADHSPGSPGLPSAVRARHIQGLYAILDELRAAQAALRGSANVTMLWERVLGLLARELSGLRAARPR